MIDRSTQRPIIDSLNPMTRSGPNMSLFPINRVRDQFPALTIRDFDKKERIYFDGPAGTQVPQSVADAVSRCLLETNANVGGHFVTSKAADKIVSDAHEAMACFLGTSDPDEIVLGANMTTLTFHLSRSICRSFEPGDEINPYQNGS